MSINETYRSGGPLTAAQAKSRIDRLMGSKLNDDEEFAETMDYLQNLDTLATTSDVTDRKLRLALQNRELELNRQFLANFEEVNKGVQTFVAKVRSMNAICGELTERIKTNKERTQELLNKTSTLTNEKKELQAQQAYITSFFEKYTLSEDDSRVLLEASAEGPISDNFFKSFQRLRAVEQNTNEALQAAPENVALLEIQQTLKEQSNKTYKTLVSALQRECRFLNVEFIELKPMLPQSIALLQAHPQLFEEILHEYSTARRSYVVRSFIDALTKGQGSSRPIEQLSTDPLRYMSDMLATCYQIVESETELLKSLLKSCAPEIITPTTRKWLCSISEALCAPLKLRVEQTLTRETNCVVLYRLSSLFLYYANQFDALMEADASIVAATRGLQELANNMFYTTVGSTVQKILSTMSTPDYDMMPVSAVHQSLLLLRDILESQNDYAFSVAVKDKKETHTRILSSILDPLNQSIQLVGSNLDSSLDVCVFILNCMNAIKSVLIMYQHTDLRLEMIKAQVEANEDVLVSEQASQILEKTNLLALYTKCVAHGSNQGPLSKIAGMEETRIVESIAAFDSFLAKPEGYRVAQSVKIASARSRESVLRRTFENVVNAYSIIYAKLTAPENGYSPLRLKTPQEVNATLVAQLPT